LEARLSTSVSKDKNMLRMFLEGLDGHGLVATLIFDECHGLHPNEVKKKFPHQRQTAKTVRFALDYGGTAFSVSRTLGIEKEEAQKLIDKYFEGFSGIRDWQAEQKRFGKKHRYVLTGIGRKRHLTGIHSNNMKLQSYYERVACNAPIQGFAADTISIAQVEIFNDRKLDLLGVKMLLQIHDELVFVIPKKYKNLACSIIKEHMENALARYLDKIGKEPLILPLPVAYDVGMDYAEAK
jgi:DNA polymerase-1